MSDSPRHRIGTRWLFVAPGTSKSGQPCVVTQNTCGVWPYIVEFEDRTHMTAFTRELQPMPQERDD